MKAYAILTNIINKVEYRMKKITNFIYKVKEYTNTTKFRVLQLCFLLILLVALIFFIWSLNGPDVFIYITDENIHKAASQNFYFYSSVLSTILLLIKRVRTSALSWLIFIVGRAIALILITKKIIKIRLPGEVDELHTVLGITFRKKWSKEDLIQFIEKRLNTEYRDKGLFVDADSAESIYNILLSHYSDNLNLSTLNNYLDYLVQANKGTLMDPDVVNAILSQPVDNAATAAALTLIVMATVVVNCIFYYLSYK